MEQVHYMLRQPKVLWKRNAISISGQQSVLRGIFNTFIDFLCYRYNINLPPFTNIVFNTISFNSLICSFPHCFMRVLLFMDNRDHIKCHLNHLVKLICIIPKLLSRRIKDMIFLSRELTRHLEHEDFSFLYNSHQNLIFDSDFLDGLMECLPKTFVEATYFSLCINTACPVDVDVQSFNYFDFSVSTRPNVYKEERYHPQQVVYSTPNWIDYNFTYARVTEPIVDSSSVRFTRFYNSYIEKFDLTDVIDKICDIRSETNNYGLSLDKMEDFLVTLKRKSNEREPSLESDTKRIKALETEVEDLKESLVKEKGVHVCAICKDINPNHLYASCGHFGLCDVCAKYHIDNNLSLNCCVCRVKSDKLIHVYYT